MAKRTNKNTVVGVEIEPSGVHAAAVSVNGSISLQHAHSVALEPGIVRDGEVADVDGLANALRTLFADRKDLDKRVRLGVANQKIVVRVLQLPVISERKEFEAAVRFSAQDEIPMPVESAILDFHPLDIVDTPDGQRQNVLLVAARRDMVGQILTAARAAGLRPEGIDLAAFAMIRALHHGDEEGDGHVLYLAVGGLTNLAVAQGSVCLFTRVVGGGLEAIAVELAERKQLTLEHARAWLEHVGLEKPIAEIDGDAAIVEDARAVLLDGTRRIAGDVRNSLDFHNAASTSGGSVSRVVLTGAAAGVAGFAEALSGELGLPVEVGAVSGMSNVNAGRLTVAAGLAVSEGRA